MGHGKLVDVTLAGANYPAMKAVVSTLLDDSATGLLMIAIGSSAQFEPERAVKPIIDAWHEAAQTRAPIMAFPIPHAPDSMTMLERGGIPTFHSVESCAETVALFLRPPQRQAALPPGALPAAVIALLESAQPGIMDEIDAGAVFEALGAQRPRQCFLDVAASPPEELPFPFPVVAKLISPDLPHKTDAGAVRINIPDRAALLDAIASMRRSASKYEPDYRLKGVLIQEMRAGLGEILIGLTRDPLVGPVVTVGMGGVLTEIYRDVAVRPAPASADAARSMLEEVKGVALLRGFRGKPRGDLDELALLISQVSLLARSDRVVEAEINPVLVGPEGHGVILLDALIRRGG